MSLGDPDLGTKWRQLRETVQPLARSVDAAIWNDPDLPGLTFPTPIIWAPWYVPVLYSKSVLCLVSSGVLRRGYTHTVRMIRITRTVRMILVR